MLLEKLYTQSLIHPPKWLIHNTMYLTIMGSNAYAVTSDNSDWDIYGFCIPPKDDVFPHLRGEWSLDQLKQYFQDKERSLEKVYSESTLQYKPNEEKIKNLLLECLEMHYGNIDSAIKRDVNVSDVISEIEKVLERFKS
jgi:hypothetical protein